MKGFKKRRLFYHKSLGCLKLRWFCGQEERDVAQGQRPFVFLLSLTTRQARLVARLRSDKWLAAIRGRPGCSMSSTLKR